MQLRLNIIVSIALHATLIASVIAFNSGGVTYRAPSDYIIVSLFKEIAGISAVTPENKESPTDGALPLIGNDEIPQAPDDPPAESGLKTKFFADSPAVPARAHSDTTEETRLLQPGAINNENNSPVSFFGKGKAGGLPAQNNEGMSRDYALIRVAIEKAKVYPLLARKKKIEGAVITEFFINSDGFPEDVKVSKSSGYEMLDSVAVQIIKKAAPFPKINRHIIIPIVFSLKD